MRMSSKQTWLHPNQGPPNGREDARRSSAPPPFSLTSAPSHVCPLCAYLQERVSACPRQVLRYAYNGVPLWSTPRPPREDPPPCVCGCPRRFELQLMPMLLAVLRVDDCAEGQDRATDSVTIEQPRAAVSVDVATESDIVVGEEGEAGGAEGEEDAAEAEAMRRRGQSMRRSLLDSGGMDWGVVTVWSCEDSCEGSVEEVVIVQDALEHDEGHS